MSMSRRENIQWRFSVGRDGVCESFKGLLLELHVKLCPSSWLNIILHVFFIVPPPTSTPTQTWLPNSPQQSRLLSPFCPCPFLGSNCTLFKAHGSFTLLKTSLIYFTSWGLHSKPLNCHLFSVYPQGPWLLTCPMECAWKLNCRENKEWASYRNFHLLHIMQVSWSVWVTYKQQRFISHNSEGWKHGASKPGSSESPLQSSHMARRQSQSSLWSLL